MAIGINIKKGTLVAATVTEADFFLFILFNIGLHVMQFEKFTDGFFMTILAISIWTVKYRIIKQLKEMERRSITRKPLKCSSHRINVPRRRTRVNSN